MQNKNGTITIRNRLIYPEVVNERIYSSIKSGMYPNFMPVSVLMKRKDKIVEVIVQGMIPASQYFAGVVSKKMFLDFASQITELVKVCEKTMISPNNLDLNKDRVFVDPITKRVKCIYWPVVNNQHADPPNVFLRLLPYDIRFNTHEDASYIEEYAAYFEGYKPFSIKEFERFLLKLQGKDTSPVRKPLDTPSGRLSRESAPVNHRQNIAAIEYNPLAVSQPVSPAQSLEYPMSFCPICGEKTEPDFCFCSSCGFLLNPAQGAAAVQTRNYNPPAQEPPGYSSYDPGTVVLGHEELSSSVYPTLIRRNTGEMFVIAKPEYRIGTVPQYCDLALYDNTFISRVHAFILTRNGHYYIVDKNSRNHTYVNGRALAPEIEVEIFNGVTIQLANEEFDFVLR